MSDALDPRHVGDFYRSLGAEEYCYCVNKHEWKQKSPKAGDRCPECSEPIMVSHLGPIPEADLDEIVAEKKR